MAVLLACDNCEKVHPHDHRWIQVSLPIEGPKAPSNPMERMMLEMGGQAKPWHVEELLYCSANCVEQAMYAILMTTRLEEPYVEHL